MDDLMHRLRNGIPLNDEELLLLKKTLTKLDEALYELNWLPYLLMRDNVAQELRKVNQYIEARKE